MLGKHVHWSEPLGRAFRGPRQLKPSRSGWYSEPDCTLQRAERQPAEADACGAMAFAYLEQPRPTGISHVQQSGAQLAAVDEASIRRLTTVAAFPVVSSL